MLDAPEIRYVRNGGVSLACQVVGDGPIDVVEVAGLFTHLEAKWEEPGLVRFDGVATLRGVPGEWSVFTVR